MPDNIKILLVEDEPKVAAFIAKGLEESNFTVTLASTIALAKIMFDQDKYDLAILDVMLPDGSGIELCQYLRGLDTGLPILILTAQDTLDSKVTGLQAGADDYLVKPFHFTELTARIAALLRRSQRPAGDQQTLRFGNLTLNLWDNTAQRGGVQINLTAKEYALLELFMRHPNKTLSRDFIADKVWGIAFDTHTNFIDVYVNYLRKKIEKGFDGKLIHTIIGMGYILRNNSPL